MKCSGQREPKTPPNAHLSVNRAMYLESRLWGDSFHSLLLQGLYPGPIIDPVN